MQIKQIVATNLYDYTVQAEQAFKEGYRICDSNENVPKQMGYTFMANLVKDETDVVVENHSSDTEVTVQVQKKGKYNAKR